MAPLPGPERLRGVASRLRSLWRGLTRRPDLESEMQEEFRQHIEMRTADLIRRGVEPAEAARRAHVEFGHVESHRERARTARGLRFFDQVRFSWLDVKLGLRMLAKHPGLTVVAGFALAVGIPVGLAPLHFFEAFRAPLPVPGGDRIRAIRYYNVGTSGPLARGASAYELREWRRELASFAALGAFRMATFTVPAPGGAGAPVRGAHVTASAFEILGARPHLGRALDAADEGPSGPDVVVIGYDLWQDRLAGDPDVIGRTLSVAGVTHTVVGVMPEGFHFPSRQHLWLPVRQAGAGDPGEAPPLWVFGRLTDGVTEDEAQAEVAAMGVRMSDAFPESREGLVAEVVPFGLTLFWMPRGSLASIPEFYAIELPALLLLIVACGNVGLLLFARAATRFRELAIRTALGASRLRILVQMFAEALVLAVLAAGAGLLATDRLMGPLFSAMVDTDADVAYTFDLGVTPETVAWGLGLAILSAVIAGVLPALKVTGRDIRQTIQRAGPGRSGIRFGGLTTVLVVCDVALAVSVIGVVALFSSSMLQTLRADEIVGIPAEEYLAVELQLPASGLASLDRPLDGEALEERLAQTQQRLLERLEGLPGVRGVAVADYLPRMQHPVRRVEVDGDPAPERPGNPAVATGRVNPGYFEALARSVVAGRTFTGADLVGDRSAVIVNTAFVERVLGGRSPLGRRIRFRNDDAGDDPPPWHVIVGVVGHLGMTLFDPDGVPGLYLPAAPGEIHPLRLAVHTGGTPESLVPRLREIVAEVDPVVAVEARPLDRVIESDDWMLIRLGTFGLATAVCILLALAVSGLYAVMSFAVSERTREIAIRTALGAGRRDVALTIARRTLWQTALGVLLGMPFLLWMLVDLWDPSGPHGAPASTVGAACLVGLSVMLVVAGLACTAPTLRALSIESSRALEADA